MLLIGQLLMPRSELGQHLLSHGGPRKRWYAQLSAHVGVEAVTQGDSFDSGRPSDRP